MVFSKSALLAIASVLAVLVFVSVTLAYDSTFSYTGVTDAELFGHSADEMNIKINGGPYNFQQAIDEGLFGGDAALPFCDQNGFVMEWDGSQWVCAEDDVGTGNGASGFSAAKLQTGSDQGLPTFTYVYAQDTDNTLTLRMGGTGADLQVIGEEIFIPYGGGDTCSGVDQVRIGSVCFDMPACNDSSDTLNYSTSSHEFTCGSDSSGSGGGVDGSGVDNYFARWDGTSDIEDSTVLYDSGTQIGVGTSSPSAKLHIVETGTSDIFRVDDISGDGTPFIIKSDGKVGINVLSPTVALDVAGDIRMGPGSIQDSGGTSRIQIVDDGAINLKDHEGTSIITIDYDGEVGIGTTSPALAKLDVEGDIRLNDSLKDAGGTDRIVLTDNGSLELKEDGGSTSITLNTAGDVGIGTTSPSAKLEVNGKIQTGDPTNSNCSTDDICSTDDLVADDGLFVSNLATVGQLKVTSSDILYEGVSDTGLYFKNDEGAIRWESGGYIKESYFSSGSNTQEDLIIDSTDDIQMAIDPNDKVFIGGTTTALGKLHVYQGDEESNVSAIYVDNDESTAATSYGLYITGNSNEGIYVGTNPNDTCYDQSGAGACALNDYAELMEFSHLPSDGEIIVVDEKNSRLLKASSKPFDSSVVGVASERPAVAIGSYGLTIKGWDETQIKQDGYFVYPLALSGRKILNATNENGEIRSGDLLTTSSMPGHAMKFSLLDVSQAKNFEELKEILAENTRRQNAVIGKALEPLNGKTGKILAIISVQ